MGPAAVARIDVDPEGLEQLDLAVAEPAARVDAVVLQVTLALRHCRLMLVPAQRRAGEKKTHALLLVDTGSEI